jgi:hypothetical protein
VHGTRAAATPCPNSAIRLPQHKFTQQGLMISGRFVQYDEPGFSLWVLLKFCDLMSWVTISRHKLLLTIFMPSISRYNACIDSACSRPAANRLLHRWSPCVSYWTVVEKRDNEIRALIIRSDCLAAFLYQGNNMHFNKRYNNVSYPWIFRHSVFCDAIVTFGSVVSVMFTVVDRRSYNSGLHIAMHLLIAVVPCIFLY